MFVMRRKLALIRERARAALRVGRKPGVSDQELSRLWNEGIASGDSPEGEMVFSRLRNKYTKQAAAEGRTK